MAGDNVPLEGSVESMVDSGVSGFMPYVHSDCGGDYRKTASVNTTTRSRRFLASLRFHTAALRCCRETI